VGLRKFLDLAELICLKPYGYTPMKNEPTVILYLP